MLGIPEPLRLASVKYRVRLSKVYLGSCVHLYSLAETSHPPPPSPRWAHMRDCYFVSQDRRHLFVTPLTRRIELCQLSHIFFPQRLDASKVIALSVLTRNYRCNVKKKLFFITTVRILTKRKNCLFSTNFPFSPCT